MAQIDVLYLTHNGITDHIGQSQIAPYCMKLAELGYRIHIVSLEKPGRHLLKERYRKAFKDRHIEWSYVTYHNKPPLLSTFLDLVRMRHLALSVARRERPTIVHCRSYLPIPIGVKIKRSIGSKLLIDFRHFWVEAGLAESRFKFVYRLFKQWEPAFFDAADHVVTLTRRAAEVLDGWYPKAAGLSRFTVIPCCADFQHFDMTKVQGTEAAALREKLKLRETDFVLLYLGSLGAPYLLTEKMRLFVQLRALNPRAKFLFVANNGRSQVESEALAQGVPLTAIRFASAQREEVPAYLKISDLSVFFIRADISLAGCSPTKLAELFAANVPVIANSGVGDLDEILDLERNCSCTVSDFQPDTLRRALRQVLEASAKKKLAIREASREFALEEGVRRYAAVYARLNAAAEQAEPVSAQAFHPKRPARSC